VFISRETPDIETSTDEYAGRFTGPVGTWLLDEQWSSVWQMLRDCPGRSVLEVGGGHGQITGSLLDHDYDVTVLGSDARCVKRVKPLLKPGRCRFHVGRMLYLPYADDSFDAVIALRLMAHMDHWQRMLQEAARVARHAVIIDYPSVYSVNSLERVLFGLKKMLEGNTRPYRCFDERTIAEACREMGFAPSDRRAQFFLPMVLHRMLTMPKVSAGMERACRAVRLTGVLGSPVVLRLSRLSGSDGPDNALRHPAAMRPVEPEQADQISSVAGFSRSRLNVPRYSAPNAPSIVR
jgi:SAM-dependent methyltransferase